MTRGSDGRLSPLRKEILARRSDGSTARSASVGPFESQQYMRKVSFLDGSSFTLAPSIRAKTTWPKLQKEQLEELRGRVARSDQDCDVRSPYSVIGYETIAEQRVVVVQRVVGRQYRLTRWLAPELGCEDLHYKSETINADGTFTLSSEATISNFSLGEPDPQLFVAGADFTELRPSEIQNRLKERMKLTLTPEQLRKHEAEGRWADALYEGRVPMQP